jgi:ketosteroid isomerase-like protein
MMKTMEIANKLVALCREGKDEEARGLLYSDDAVSVEAGAPPGKDPEMKGLAAIRAKSEWWYANHEIHQVTITGPWPHGDRFILGFNIDVTPKASGQRFQMDEMALYTIRNGKIVREEFFYHMGG